MADILATLNISKSTLYRPVNSRRARVEVIAQAICGPRYFAPGVTNVGVEPITGWALIRSFDRGCQAPSPPAGALETRSISPLGSPNPAVRPFGARKGGPAASRRGAKIAPLRAGGSRLDARGRPAAPGRAARCQAGGGGAAGACADPREPLTAKGRVGACRPAPRRDATGGFPTGGGAPLELRRRLLVRATSPCRRTDCARPRRESDPARRPHQPYRLRIDQWRASPSRPGQR